MNFRDDSIPSVDPDEARDALKRLFTDTIAAAPPVPSRVLAAAEGRRPVTARRRSMYLAAAATLLVGAIALLSERRLDASPAAVISRATQRFLGLTDARLQVAFGSPLFRFLESLDDDHEPKGESSLDHEVDIRSPNLVLVRARSGPAPHGVRDCYGYDGEVYWDYDEDENVVLVQEPGEEHPFEGIDFTAFLGFDFLRSLDSSQGEYEIVETTSAFERRVGRRSFELERTESEAEESSVFWTTVRFVIDPSTDVIEKYSLQIAAGPVGLFTIDVELVDVNLGFDPGHFRFSSHVPSGAVIRHGEAVDGIQINSKIRIHHKRNP